MKTTIISNAVTVYICNFLSSPPITPYLDHVDPYMVPYDFPTLGHSELQPLSLASVAHQDASLPNSQLNQQGGIGAESSINTVTDMSSGLQAANLAGAGSHMQNNAGSQKTLKKSDLITFGKVL